MAKLDAEKAAVKAAKDAGKPAVKAEGKSKDGPCAFADTSQGQNTNSKNACSKGGRKTDLCGICGKPECKGVKEKGLRDKDGKRTERVIQVYYEPK